MSPIVSNPLEHTPWKPKNSSANSEIPCILWNPKFRYYVYQTPSLCPTLSQRNPVHAFPSNLRSPYHILIIKPTRGTNLSNYFWNRTLHVSDNFSVHHQESSTVHTAIYTCHTGYADCFLASSQHNLYVLLCEQCYTPDDGQRNCPKHVEFYSKNKFEKLVDLVGFHYKNISRCTVLWMSNSPYRTQHKIYDNLQIM